ncbi:morphogenic membrane protein MmpA [Streptomyces sp. NPDC015346]
MTAPASLPTSPRPAERGMTAILAFAGLVALAWVCAMVYVVAAWVMA